MTYFKDFGNSFCSLRGAFVLPKTNARFVRLLQRTRGTFLLIVFQLHLRIQQWKATLPFPPASRSCESAEVYTMAFWNLEESLLHQSQAGLVQLVTLSDKGLELRISVKSSFTHSLSKLSTHFKTGTLPCAGYTTEHSRQKFLPSWTLKSSGGR